MHDHADESAHDNFRFDVNKCPIALTLANVTAEKLVNPQNKLFPKHSRQLVLFQRRMQQQTLKLRIAFVLFQSMQRQPLENRAVVFPSDGFGDDLAGIHLVVQTGFVIENRAVEFLLGREVLKEHRF